MSATTIQYLGADLNAALKRLNELDDLASREIRGRAAAVRRAGTLMPRRSTGLPDAPDHYAGWNVRASRCQHDRGGAVRPKPAPTDSERPPGAVAGHPHYFKRLKRRGIP